MTISTISRQTGIVLRAPALHFVLIGVALFGLHAWARRARPAARDPRRIVVGADFTTGLAEQAARRGAQPVDSAALVDQYVDEEVLYREALALGLDRGDPIVRRRLVQKMEFLLQDAAADPSAAEIAAYATAHAAPSAAAPPQWTFEQIFFRDEAAAARGRTALAGGADPATVGEAFPLPRRNVDRTETEIAAQFGAAFAVAVAATAVADATASVAWSAPLRSGFGFHLVRVTARRPGRAPATPAMRAALIAERREAARRAAVGALRASYDVTVEAPR